MKAVLTKAIFGAAITTKPAGTQFDVVTFGNTTSVVRGLEGLTSIYNDEFEIIAEPVRFFDLQVGDHFYNSIADFKMGEYRLKKVDNRTFYLVYDPRPEIKKIATYNARRMMVFKAIKIN